MQRSDNPLNKLFDAARQEQSPLSEGDVRALLNEANQKPNRRPVMIPMIIAGAIITIAGLTSSVVMQQINQSVTERPRTERTVQDSHRSQTLQPSDASLSSQMQTTPSAVESTFTAKTATSSKLHITKLSSNDNTSDPVFWMGDPNAPNLGLCRVKILYPTTPASNTDNETKVYFATVSANREVTDRLAEPNAPVPVLCTDNRGRACSKTDVAYFASNYNAIADDLNNLVPVTYAGREDILVWYSPSAELVEAFPDSLRGDLETLLDIDIDINIEMPDLPIMPALPTMPDLPSKIYFLKIDSLIALFKNQLHCDDAKSPQSSINTFTFNDSSVKSFKIQMRGLDSSMKTIDFNVNGNLDSISALLRQFTPSTYTDLKALSNYEELMKHPNLLPTLRNMDSTMKMLQIQEGTDSLNKMYTELLKQYGIDMNVSAPNKIAYKFRKQLHFDTAVGDGKTSNKQHFKSRIIIKSNMKRNKNRHVLPYAEKLSELTPTTIGAITSTSVYPNPATEGGATMSYVLSDARTLTLTLLDLNGTVVATMMQDAKRSSGNGQFAFTLSNIPAGMYLVNLTTDKGERAIQRLIVQ